MARELDKRDFNFDAVSGFGLGPDAPDLDPFTGSLRRVELDTSGFDDQSTRVLAIELARQASEQASGFVNTEPADFGLPQDVGRTSAGAEVAHVQQLHRGIPVFQSGRTVQMRPDGQAAVTGAAVEELERIESDPTLDARAAAVAAAVLDEGDDQESPDPTMA